MAAPVIGQIRTFQDVQRALENIRAWVLSQQQESTQSQTIQIYSQQQSLSGCLLSASNLSDVIDKRASFDTIKQKAAEDYEGVSRYSTSAEVIAGEDALSAITPAGLSSKIDTDPTMAANSNQLLPSQAAARAYIDAIAMPHSLFVRCHDASLALKYMPLSVDQLINGHLADGTAVTIPLTSGA